MDKVSVFINSFLMLYYELSFYLLIGLISVSCISFFFSKKTIIKHLALNQKMSWIKGALFGIPLPLCSCGVIPTAKYFKENKVSIGGVSSFLISTPTTGVDSIMIYYGLLGLPAAIIRPITSFLMGILGGFFMDKVFFKNTDHHKEELVLEEEILPTKLRIKNSFEYGFYTFLNDMHGRFLIGILLTTVISFFISDDNVLIKYMLGGGFVAYVLTIILGLPMYICATASIPIALAFMSKGMSIGTAFVFLTAGPVFSISSMVMLKQIFNSKELFYYTVYIILSSIALGYSVDFIYDFLSLPLPNLSGAKHEMSPLGGVASAVFTFFLFLSIYRVRIKKYFVKN